MEKNPFFQDEKEKDIGVYLLGQFKAEAAHEEVWQMNAVTVFFEVLEGFKKIPLKKGLRGHLTKQTLSNL